MRSQYCKSSRLLHIMGLAISFLGGGFSPKQLLNSATESLYTQFTKEKIQNFEDFHVAILNIFVTLNSAMPGKHYDVPPWKEIEECFQLWHANVDSEKKEVFVKFMKQWVNLGKTDRPIIITGLITPPAAMAAKRAGESVPNLNFIKAIPDVVFVPSFTVVALVSVKLTKKIFMGSNNSNNV